MPEAGWSVTKKVPARNTPSVLTPSPFQSQASGTSPRCPNATPLALAPGTLPDPWEATGATGGAAGRPLVKAGVNQADFRPSFVLTSAPETVTVFAGPAMTTCVAPPPPAPTPFGAAAR